MNERLKQLRKSLGLSGEKFAEKLGVTKSAIYNIEQGTRNITGQMILSICREFRVSEEWLRNGTGEMFVSRDGISLEEYLATIDLSPVDIEVVKAYFSMDKSTRIETLKKLKIFLNGLDI